MGFIDRVVFHHTAVSSDDDTTSLDSSKAKVRAIQNYHMDVNGWSDIGYHFLADKLGNGFEGRETSIDAMPRGAHDGINEGSIGVVLMGYFHAPYDQVPTIEGRCAAYRIAAWKIPDPFDGLGAGDYKSLSEIGFVAGHRDVAATACPGDLFYDSHIGADVWAGEARSEINSLITQGSSALCDGGETLPSPDAPTLAYVKSGSDGTSITLSFSDVGAVLHYNLYVSDDGVVFGAPIQIPSAQTSYTDTGLWPGATRYYKVSAVGAATESRTSDVYGARVSSGTPSILIVDGDDRWPTQPENPGGYNHDFAAIAGRAIAEIAFDTVDNDALLAGDVSLSSYAALVWILGEESTAHQTFSPAEQSLVSSYLTSGGKLFVSGAEIGWDLVEKGSSADNAFYAEYLKARYVSDDGNSYLSCGRAGGLFNGICGIDFSPGIADIAYPDLIAPRDGASTELVYGDSAVKKKTAGIRYSGAFGLVYFGFPFESIKGEAVRTEIMERVLCTFGLGQGCSSSKKSSGVASYPAPDLGL